MGKEYYNLINPHLAIQPGDIFVSIDCPTINEKIRFYQITKMDSNNVYAIEIVGEESNHRNITQAIPMKGKIYSEELLVSYANEIITIPGHGTAKRLDYTVYKIDGIDFKLYEITKINSKTLKSVK